MLVCLRDCMYDLATICNYSSAAYSRRKSWVGTLHTVSDAQMRMTYECWVHNNSSTTVLVALYACVDLQGI